MNRSTRRLALLALAQVLVACGMGTAGDVPDVQDEELRCRRTGCPKDAGQRAPEPDASGPASDAGSLAPDASSAGLDAGVDPGPDATAPAPDASSWAPAVSCNDLPLRATGTTYYFCDCGTAGTNPSFATCDGHQGDDANAGTSIHAPKRSAAAAASQIRALTVGDTVAFCRSGYWDGVDDIAIPRDCGTHSSTWPEADATTTTCDVRDYALPGRTTSDPKPRLVNTQIRPGGNGQRFWNLDLVPYRGLAAVRDFSGGAHNWIDVCSVDATSQTPLGTCDDGQTPKHITTEDLAFSFNGTAPWSVRGGRYKNFSYAGFLVGTTGAFLMDGVTIENCGTRLQVNTSFDRDYDGVVDTDGRAGQSCAGVFWSMAGSRALYMDTLGPGSVIRNTEVIADGTYIGGQPLAAVHWDGVTIENNYWHVDGPTTGHEWGCVGVMATGPSASQSRDQNVVFRRNRFALTNGGECFVADVGCIHDSTFESNIFEGGTVYLGGGDLSGAGCINGEPSSDDLFINNTIYRGDLWVRDAGGAFTVRNNAVYDSGATCFEDAWRTGVTQDHNVCVPNATAAWVAPANEDFTPVLGGPLDDTGSSTSYSATAIGSVTWSPTDTGVPRTPPVDVGAMVR